MSRDLPPLNALRAFEAVARLDSVTRAAEELHVTHGAISRHLRTLEDSLGTPLFAREGRGLALTAAGHRLHEAADAAFAPLRRAWADLHRRTQHAPLVLGCPGSLLARWVIPRLDRLGRELPELTLHLSPSEAPPDARLTGLDAALLIAQAPWPQEWQVHELAAERIGPVVSPRFAGFERLRDAPASDLLDLPLLHTTSRPQAWRDWAARSGLDAQALQLGTGFAHLYYLLEAAEAGLGVAIAPQPLVAEDIANGRLVAPWGFVETDGRWALCAPRRGEAPRVAMLAQWLRRELVER